MIFGTKNLARDIRLWSHHWSQPGGVAAVKKPPMEPPPLRSIRETTPWSHSLRVASQRSHLGATQVALGGTADG